MNVYMLSVKCFLAFKFSLVQSVEHLVGTMEETNASETFEDLHLYIRFYPATHERHTNEG